jgi:hypothetical protein
MKAVAVAKRFATLAFLFAFLAVLPAVRADERDQATRFTFSQPVQIPGRVLPAGTYTFEIVNGFNPELVRISNADRTNVIALIQAIPSAQGFSGNAAIILAERQESQPAAIIAWSYPGRLEGHQFVYPKQVQSELAKVKRERIVFGD